ncbi:DUF4240 domain-containing protein [Kineosporia succinea]|uniref:DUF4240 domain-containing protein n=1 Tax=Kineosporia succinea TaxID=84632 RepID=A0ABT9PEV7_9ACTN|nr:DUF4240 domain-containing protein [Kineosporia succinea]MDP9831238.1 hypothetical protein [Kineosporia succinea]
MEIDRFWEIVEAARAVPAPFDEALFNRLRQLPGDEIVEFGRRFGELQLELYRWDVWGAAYLIGGGCSDDAFIDFCAGVISLGREWLEQPDSLATHPEVQAEGGDQFEPLFYEEVTYVPARAWRQATGGTDFPQEPVAHDRDMGESFDFDDESEMRRRYPSLAPVCL